jgi:hypothetical protein
MHLKRLSIEILTMLVVFHMRTYGKVDLIEISIVAFFKAKNVLCYCSTLTKLFSKSRHKEINIQCCKIQRGEVRVVLPVQVTRVHKRVRVLAVMVCVSQNGNCWQTTQHATCQLVTFPVQYSIAINLYTTLRFVQEHWLNYSSITRHAEYLTHRRI